MQITIEFKTVEGLKVELRDLLSALNNPKPEKTKAKEAVDKVVEQAAEVAATAQAYAEAKAIHAEPVPIEKMIADIDAGKEPYNDPEPDVEDDIPPADYETAKGAILELNKSKGREAALEILGRFGVSKLPDLAAEHFGAVTAAARQAVAS